MRIILERTRNTNLPLDLGSIQPVELLALSTRDIQKLPIKIADRAAVIADCFTVRRNSSGPDELLLRGVTDNLYYVGKGMQGGRLIIEGDVGAYTGHGMAAGRIEIHGNAGDCLGLELAGGEIRVAGNAGDWTGAAETGKTTGMTGGTILVHGNAGIETGAYMRRGLIGIGGNCGSSLGARMRAGTILCMGNADSHPGIGMKRGSLVIDHVREILPGFRPSGKADTGWLHVYLNWLKSCAFPIPASWWEKTPERYSGDHLESGKGEILFYAKSE